MFSLQENISSPHCDTHHHYYPYHYSRKRDQNRHQPHPHHDDHDRHRHQFEENPQLKLRLDGKQPRKIPSKTDEIDQIRKLVTKKRPTTEEDQVGVCEANQRISKVCADCKTSKTPLWRSGPAGPKSLCNACGIRYRKRRRRGLEFIETSRDIWGKDKQGQERVLFLMQREFEGKEEAEAAVLLMALSCGLFFH